MADRNNNNSFSNDTLDLTRIYGLDDIMNGSNQNLEDLAGYNLNESELNMPMNNSRNVDNNEDNMQSSRSENMQQNAMNSQNNMRTGQQEQAENQMTPRPQRQEQTMPTTREPQNNNNLRNMQANGNIEAFLRTQIGKNVRMQFLIGTNTLIEKAGVLIAVGDNFVVLKEAGSGETLVCDFDGAKFIRLEDNSR